MPSLQSLSVVLPFMGFFRVKLTTEMLRAEPVPLSQEEGANRGNLPDAERNRRRSLGIYYTPKDAADLLATWAIRDASDTVLEPSFGGCSLLAAALLRLRSLTADTAKAQLIGYDVDSAAFGHLAKLLGDAVRPLSFVKRDFLTVSPNPQRVDAVIANPPFVSYHRMAAEQRQSVLHWRSRYAAEFPLTASLWAYFLVHAMAFLRPGGRMAFVLPAAAVRSDYSVPVMAKVAQKFARLSVYRLEEQLFLEEGAQERAVVLLADGYEQGQSTLPTLQVVNSVSDLEAAMAIAQPAKCPDEFDDASQRLVDRLAETGRITTMKDVASVSIGEVIGDTRFFVQPLRAWQQLGIPKANLRPLLTRSQQVVGRLRISKSDVEGQALPFLLLPDCQVRPGKVRDYLARYPIAKRDSNVTFGKRPFWQRATYSTSADAFFPSISHCSPRVILNSAGISCANGFYKLHAKPGVRWRASTAAASLTAIFRWSAEAQGRPMGGGAMKLEPSDVRQLLLPSSAQELTGPISAQLHRDLDKLLRSGRQEEAADLADRVLLLQPKVLTKTELNALRNAIRVSQERRMQRSR